MSSPAIPLTNQNVRPLLSIGLQSFPQRINGIPSFRIRAGITKTISASSVRHGNIGCQAARASPRTIPEAYPPNLAPVPHIQEPGSSFCPRGVRRGFVKRGWDLSRPTLLEG